MSTTDFIDYYELLQLSPNADTETIKRVFRHLAKRCYPENSDSVDSERFRQIVAAHQILIDPETRAGYDVKYQDYWNKKWNLAADASDGSTFGNDQETRERLLSLLYVQRRRDMYNPGMGEYEVASLLSTPIELVEFHVWYLKAKGWVERIPSGQMAITALGVDQVELNRLRPVPERLKESDGVAAEQPEN